ncbi:hypothetical protein H6F86_00420 [Phormidium sp. FACHB-592]|uniref:Uncharacterized protein n=1 Tax=Stenomitos frigidus AS-A4 TaxID=2933935 RepID=A0ABV0KT82_9CYAN|nr:hypothetical protein [Phormidium sp. FACHB-592]MBD2072398.1 hypothetical protein [Phormidium sp. FACHB-592]
MVTRKDGTQPRPSWGDRPKPQDSTEPTYTRPKRKADWFGGLLLLAQFLSAAFTIWLIWQSVEVYVQVGSAIASHTLTTTLPKWLDWFIAHTWFIGAIVKWFLDGGVALVSIAAMLALYIILQIGEVAPLLLENSPRTLRRLIGSIASHNRMPIGAKDHRTVQFLKEKHNAIPTAWVDSIYTAKWICYGVDFLICLLACPPIRGGWDRLQIVMAAPTMSDFDFVNAAKIAITLFAVEVGFFVYLWIKRGRTILNTPEPNAEQANEA